MAFYNNDINYYINYKYNHVDNNNYAVFKLF